MRSRTLLYVIPLILVIALFAIPGNVPSTHANPGSGQVCIQDVTSVSPTNPSPCTHVGLNVAPHFDGPVTNATTGRTPNQQITVGVYVNGSDPGNGWDVTLIANHHYLVPTSVDPTNSIFGPVFQSGATLSIIVLCLQGVLKIGSTCLSTDTIDTLHYSVDGGKTTPGLPVSGLLFTATYNITNTTPTGGIAIDYQVGCIGAVSVPGKCVTITNGTPTPDVETTLSAVFDNSQTPAPGVGTGTAGIPYVTLNSSSTHVTALVNNNSPAVTLTASAQNGWPGPTGCVQPSPGCSTDFVTFSAITSSSKVTASLAPGTGCATGGTSCSPSSPITLKGTATGNYSVTFFASYIANSFTTGQNDTLAATFTVTLTVTDFTWTLSPSTVYVASGAPPSVVTIGTAKSLSGFSGTVTLTSVVVAGYKVTFSPASLSVPAGGSATSMISLNTTALSGAVTTLTTRATTSGLATPKSTALSVHVVSDPTSTTLSCHPSTLDVFNSTTCTVTATDTATAPTNPGGTGTFSNGGAAGSFTPSGTCTLSPNGGAAATCSATYAPGATGSQSISAFYSGDTVHATSFASSPFGLTVLAAPTSSLVSCHPATLTVNNSTSCAVTVTDTSPVPTVPSGTATFSNGGASGSFTGSGTCSLVMSSPSAASCSLSYSPTATGSQSISSTYNGDANHATSTTATPFGLTVQAAPTSTRISCNPSTTYPSIPTSCSANVTDTSPSPTFPTGTITFSNNGGTGSFTPANGMCTLARIGTTTTSTCSVTYTPSAPGPQTISATYGGDPTHTTSTSNSFALAVSTPDFQLRANPSSIAIPPSSSDSSIVTLTSQGFVGNVTFTVSVVPSTGLTFSLNRTSAVLHFGGTNVTKVTMNGSAGSYALNLTGTSGSLHHSIIINVNIFDYSVTPSTTTVSQLDIGNAGMVTATVTSLGGSGTVSLSYTADSGLTCSLTPTRVTVGASPVSSTMSCTATVVGNLNVTIVTNSTSLTHSTGKILFNIVDFQVIASPVNVSPVNVGTIANSTLTVTYLNGFSKTVGLSTQVSGGGAIFVGFSPSSLTASGTSQMGVGATLYGNYTVAVVVKEQGGFGLTHTVQVSFEFKDVGISASPKNLNIIVGTSGTTTITVSSLNHFSGTVSLAATLKTPGLPAATFSQNSLVLVSDGTATSTMTISVPLATFPFNYIFNVTATGGTAQAFILVNATVPAPDFTLSASQTLVQNQPARSPATVTLTVTPQNGFIGDVTFSLAPASGMTASVNPTTVTGGSGTTTLTITSTTSGSFSVTVTGTSGTLTHSLTVTMSAVDFTLTAASTTVSFDSGNSATSTITLTALNGFTGTITLSVSTPSALSAVLNPSAVTNSGTSTVTVTGSQTGTYNVTISASSGSLLHKVIITVTVNAQTLILGLAPTVFYSLVGVLVAIVVLGTAFVLIRRGRTKP